MAYLLAIVLLLACSDSTGPQMPQLAGNWNGLWRAQFGESQTFTLALTQAGGDLGGTFTVGAFTFAVDGIVTQFGRVTFDVTYPGEDTPNYSFAGDIETSERIAGVLTDEVAITHPAFDAVLTRQH